MATPRSLGLLRGARVAASGQAKGALFEERSHAEGNHRAHDSYLPARAACSLCLTDVSRVVVRVLQHQDDVAPAIDLPFTRRGGERPLASPRPLCGARRVKGLGNKLVHVRRAVDVRPVRPGRGRRVDRRSDVLYRLLAVGPLQGPLCPSVKSRMSPLFDGHPASPAPLGHQFQVRLVVVLPKERPLSSVPPLGQVMR
jgi:hypothetical protein